MDTLWTPRHQLAPDLVPGRTLLCPPEPKPAKAPEPRNPWLVYPEDLIEKSTPTNPIPVENSASSAPLGEELAAPNARSQNGGTDKTSG